MRLAEVPIGAVEVGIAAGAVVQALPQPAALAGGGQLYRLGAGAFVMTGEGREQASYRIVDLRLLRS